MSDALRSDEALRDEALRPDTLAGTYQSLHDRGEGVAWWPHGGYWFVAGYDEVAEAAKDDVTFSSRHDLPNGTSPFRGVMVPPTPVEAIPIELEPDDHTLYRRFLSPRFTAAGIRRIEPQIRADAADYLDRHLASGRIDLFHDYVKLIPAVTTLDIMGLSRASAVDIADAVHVRGPGRFVLSGKWAELIEETLRVMVDRRRHPTEDLLSDLANGTVGGKPIPESDAVKVCLTMIVGGMSTTAKAGVGALWYLGTHPEERQRLLDDATALAMAIDEFLRYFSPVPFLLRTATRDTVLGGQEICAGQRLALGWGAANRDPSVFDNPDEIDIHRTPNRHLAMGVGATTAWGPRWGSSS